MEISYGAIVWRYHMELSYGDITWRYHMEISYGDIIWWYDMEMFDFWWVLKHKFHGLVGPPGAIFEKNNNLQNQEEKFRFSRMALYHVLIAQEYSRHSQLQESCLNIFHLPIFDRFMAYRRSKKNFGPNVIYCFLGYVDIVWRYHMELSYGDIIWSYRMEISHGDIIWRYHMEISYDDMIWRCLIFDEFWNISFMV